MRIDLLGLTMKIEVLKVTDIDNYGEEAMYFTIKTLRDQILNEWYDLWDDGNEKPTKEEIKKSDEKVLEYMDSFGYNVEEILTITEKDVC
jgi:hypothetical protein